jgi:sulfatase maturation enzyme AslB (radical SAM superfamily)
MTTSTICPIPWTHLSIQQNGDFRACCQCIYAPYGQLTSNNKTLNIATADLNEARNHPVLKDLRKSMLQGEKHPLCNLCWKEEEHGLFSKRSNMVKKYDVSNYQELTQPDGTIDTTQFPLRYIDIRFGNLCNLKCRYCGPADSSLWAEDYALMADGDEVRLPFYKSNEYKIKQINNVWKIDSQDFEWYDLENFWIQIKKLIPYIDRYYFTGGEPTVNKAHFKLLELIIEMEQAPNVILEYNSNIVAIPDKLFTLWKSFKSVEIGCSVDASGDLANYLRYPSEWEVLKENLIKIDQAGPNITAGIATTISVYNIRNFLELTTWLIAQPFKRVKIVPSYHVLEGPAHMSIQVLPLEVKQQINQEYEDFYVKLAQTDENKAKIIRTAFTGITNYMFAEDRSNLLGNLKIATDKLDNVRNQQLENYLPWLVDIINQRS